MKLLCVDVPPQNSRGEVDIPENATVEQALEQFARERQLLLPLSEFKRSAFLVNNVSAALDSCLHDGDTLTVMRTLAGG